VKKGKHIGDTKTLHQPLGDRSSRVCFTEIRSILKVPDNL